MASAVAVRFGSTCLDGVRLLRAQQDSAGVPGRVCWSVRHPGPQALQEALASTGLGITLTWGSFIVQQAEQQGSVAEVLSLKQVLPQAQELAESLAAEAVTGPADAPAGLVAASKESPRPWRRAKP